VRRLAVTAIDAARGRRLRLRRVHECSQHEVAPPEGLASTAWLAGASAMRHTRPRQGAEGLVHPPDERAETRELDEHLPPIRAPDRLDLLLDANSGPPPAGAPLPVPDHPRGGLAPYCWTRRECRWNQCRSSSLEPMPATLTVRWISRPACVSHRRLVSHAIHSTSA
jgi:hypothetical protein